MKDKGSRNRKVSIFAEIREAGADEVAPGECMFVANAHCWNLVATGSTKGEALRRLGDVTITHFLYGGVGEGGGVCNPGFDLISMSMDQDVTNCKLTFYLRETRRAFRLQKIRDYNGEIIPPKKRVLLRKFDTKQAERLRDRRDTLVRC